MNLMMGAHDRVILAEVNDLLTVWNWRTREILTTHQFHVKLDWHMMPQFSFIRTSMFHYTSHDMSLMDTNLTQSCGVYPTTNCVSWASLNLPAQTIPNQLAPSPVHSHVPSPARHDRSVFCSSFVIIVDELVLTIGSLKIR